MVYVGEYDVIQVYLGELEIQCIATPETHADWKFRREDRNCWIL